MKRIMIFILLIIIYPVFTFAQTNIDPYGGKGYFEPQSQKKITSLNPDGQIGTIIVTCLGGFTTGSGNLTQGYIFKESAIDLSGYHFHLGIETPASNSSTLIINLDFITRKNSSGFGNQLSKEELSVFSVLGGIRFFINP